MKQHSQRGVALVITLIMLSVVMVMAIIFLGISRRERASVGVATSLQDARLAADAGLARAQAEVLARIAASSNLLDYDLFVSTNYQSYQGFDSAQSVPVDPLNVNYYYPPHGSTNRPVQGDDQLVNLQNLYLDPRPPVFVTSPDGRSQDFRFYLDLNRNGRFDTNGWNPVVQNGVVLNATNWMWGDPEWVGILERSDLPHSGTNRFLMRYAYIALPAGKSLDINFIGNNARRLGGAGGPTTFNRNQGVGSWELNLAAFLRKWLPARYDLAGDYLYRTNGANQGLAFQHAQLVHYFRLQKPEQPHVGDILGARAAALAVNGFDDFSDDVPPGGTTPAADNDALNTPWPAYDYPAVQLRNQEFFQTNGARQTLLPIATNLLAAGRDVLNTSNRFAFYRMLSQLGTDSLPAGRGRVHLNYTNGYWAHPRLNAATGRWSIQAGIQELTAANKGTPVILDGTETNLQPWSTDVASRTHFMMLATHQILVSQMGDVFPNGLSDGIQVWPTNNYVGAVHRCAQLAANILDVSTRDLHPNATATNQLMLPSVFRPVFQASSIQGRPIVLLVGFEEASDASSIGGGATTPWLKTTEVKPATVTSDTRIYGIPWVVGAKKGWPSFNEFYSENTVQVNRRLQARKNGGSITFEQSYDLGVTNVFGIESWNSYENDLQLNLTLVCTNETDIYLRDTRVYTNTLPQSIVRATSSLLTNSLALTNWPGRVRGVSSFHTFTNSFKLVPRASYLPSNDPTNALVWTAGISFGPFPNTGGPVPEWKLDVTNHLLFALTTRVGATTQIVDFVTLSPVLSGFDVTRVLQGTNNMVGGTNQLEDSFWATNQTVLRNPKDNSILPGRVTRGITNQIYACVASNLVPVSLWNSFDQTPVTGRQRERAIDEFRMFLGMQPVYDERRTNVPVTVMQVPFTPGRRLVQSQTWAANDPLVHYHIADLETELSDTNRVQVQRVGTASEGYNANLPNLSQVNSRYQPWPTTVAAGDGSGFSYSPWVKDPWVRSSDDWEFPTNSLPNVGWLGRVHRGTPWQTIYLKSEVEPLADWRNYMGKRGDSPWTHPTNDWRLMDVFTATPNANASRGLLSVNQTNEAAWAAVFDGVRVLTNSFRRNLNPNFNFAASSNYTPVIIDSDSAQFNALVRGINRTRSNFVERLAAGNVTNGIVPVPAFKHLGDILATPELTAHSPYLALPTNAAPNTTGWDGTKLTDAVMEALPQQILGLLRPDEPYLVVYSYGQALRPANNSLIMRPGKFFNLCTNYEITGEVLTKTGFRIVQKKQGTNVFYDTVLENFSILPVE